MTKKIAKHLTSEMLNEASGKYTNLLNMANELGTTRSILLNTFDHFNIIAPLHHTNATHNNNFFSEITEQSMFLAGFIAADGCLLKGKGKQRTLSIKLQTKDLGFLNQIKNILQSNKNIYSYEKEKSSCLMVNSYQIYEDLVNIFGLTPNKTKTYIIPDLIINHELFPHFIRGYIDGDGCFYTNKNSCLSMLGASESIIQIYNYIKEKCNCKSGSLYSTVSKFGTKLWNLKFSAKQDLLSIIDMLYKNASIYLERKKKTADIIKDKFLLTRTFIPEELEKLYKIHNSFVKMGEILECSPSTIRQQMIKLGIKYTKSQHKHKDKIFDFDPIELKNNYNKVGSSKLLAELYDCSNATISNALRDNNISVKRKSKHKID